MGLFSMSLDLAVESRRENYCEIVKKKRQLPIPTKQQLLIGMPFKLK